MTAKQMLTERLQADGYSGLYNTWAECGCGIDDLAPCDGIQLECVAGHRQTCKSCGEEFTSDKKLGACPDEDCRQ